MKTVFSIIIPTYNRAPFLRDALRSVFAQEYRDFEVLVVDDGSTDDSETVARQFGASVKFLRQQNLGPGAARNLGVRQACGEFVAFLDSDDVWFPWTLKKMHEVARGASKPGFIVGHTLDFQEVGDVEAVQASPTSVRGSSDYLSAAQASAFAILTCSSVCVRRTELLRAGCFATENMNAEDSDLWLRLGTVPGFAMIQAPVICGYRRHPVSAVANLEKTVRGMNHLVATELSGSYPGGSARRKERLEIICRHVRPASVSLGRNRNWKDAVSLYVKTSPWNCQLGRWKYLLGFWPNLLLQAARRTEPPIHPWQPLVQP